jgi:hypothetical protein
LLRGGIGVGRVGDPGATKVGAREAGIGTFIGVIFEAALGIVPIVNNAVATGAGLSRAALGSEGPALRAVNFEDWLAGVVTANADVHGDAIVGVKVCPEGLAFQG